MGGQISKVRLRRFIDKFGVAELFTALEDVACFGYVMGKNRSKPLAIQKVRCEVPHAVQYDGLMRVARKLYRDSIVTLTGCLPSEEEITAQIERRLKEKR